MCQTRPDLNGILGSIIEWDDAERRWKARDKKKLPALVVVNLKGVGSVCSVTCQLLISFVLIKKRDCSDMF
jgi:hypothetical protein